MYFKFNQGKKFKIINTLTALLFNFINSAAIAAMCYGLANVVLILFMNRDIDVVSLNYALIFVGIFAAVFICFNIYYLKTKKGVTIDEEKITISMGYFCKYQMLHDSYSLSDIEKIEYIEKYNLKDLKKLNKGFDFGARWFLQEYGTAMKNQPVIEIYFTGSERRYTFGGHICVVSCENNEKIIELFNSYKR